MFAAPVFRAAHAIKVAVAPVGRRTNDKQVVGANNDSSSIHIGVRNVDCLIDLVGELACAWAAAR